jgi:hypothetical protein
VVVIVILAAFASSFGAKDVYAAAVIDTHVLGRIQRVEIDGVKPLHRDGSRLGIQSEQLFLQFPRWQFLQVEWIFFAKEWFWISLLGVE